jgi:hypothetical protein
MTNTLLYCGITMLKNYSAGPKCDNKTNTVLIKKNFKSVLFQWNPQTLIVPFDSVFFQSDFVSYQKKILIKSDFFGFCAVSID